MQGVMHILVLCFAIDSPESLKNVKKKVLTEPWEKKGLAEIPESWVSEIMHYCYGHLVFLVECAVNRELYGCLEQSQRLSERRLRNLNCSHSPSLAAIAGGHLSSDTFTLCHSVDVVRVGGIQNNLGVGPRYTVVQMH